MIDVLIIVGYVALTVITFLSIAFAISWFFIDDVCIRGVTTGGRTFDTDRITVFVVSAFLTAAVAASALGIFK